MERIYLRVEKVLHIIYLLQLDIKVGGNVMGIDTRHNAANFLEQHFLALPEEEKMKAQLNAHLLNALKVVFPFLGEWKPSRLHSAYLPVEFEVKPSLDMGTVFPLEYGRRNNEEDMSYTAGVTHLGITDGVAPMQWITLHEGKTTLADVVKPETRYVMTRYRYRSELIRNEPGIITYTLYLYVPAKEVIEGQHEIAGKMKEELEGGNI